MKWLFTFSLLIALVSAGIAQDGSIEEGLKKRIENCETISFNASELFVYYMQNEEYDSVVDLLTIWEEECGVKEPQVRARLLYSLTINEYIPELWDHYFYERLSQFKYRLDYKKRKNANELYDINKTYFGYVPFDRAFDTYSRLKASEIIDQFPDSSSQKLVCILLMEEVDSFYKLMQTEEYDSTNMAQLYQSDLKEVLDLPEGLWRFKGGLWMPSGEMEKMGYHPELGFEMSGMFNKWGGGLDMMFRFLPSQEEYTYQDADTTITNDYYFAFVLGLNASYNLSRSPHKRLHLTLATGIDVFDTYKTTEEEIAPSVSTGYISPGVEWLYKFKGNQTISVGYQYRLMNYARKDFTELSGNAQLIHIGFGWMNNEHKESELKRLKFVGY